MADMGAAILPHHLANKLRGGGAEIATLAGSKIPLKNTISLASLRGRTRSRAAEALTKFVIDQI